MNAPAFQLYAQDFLTGCIFLTNEEVGIYIRVLTKQWTDGKIPKKRLGLFLGLNWESFSDELKDKFCEEGEFIYNKRLEFERQKMVEFQKKQSENGKKGGRPSKNASAKESSDNKALEENKNPNKTQIKPNTKAKKSSSIEDEEEDEYEKEIEIDKEEKKFEKKFFEKFNEKCTRLPKVQILSKERKQKISEMIKQFGEEKSFLMIDFLSESNYLNGENERGWKASFDWVIEPKNFAKILEGNYKNRKQNGNSKNTQNGLGNNTGNSTSGSYVPRKASFNEILARKLAEQNSANSESGNITVDAEVVE